MAEKVTADLSSPSPACACLRWTRIARRAKLDFDEISTLGQAAHRETAMGIGLACFARGFIARSILFEEIQIMMLKTLAAATAAALLAVSSVTLAQSAGSSSGSSGASGASGSSAGGASAGGTSGGTGTGGA